MVGAAETFMPVGWWSVYEFWKNLLFSMLRHKHIYNGHNMEIKLKPIYIRQSSGTVLMNIPQHKNSSTTTVASGKISFGHSLFYQKL